MLYDLSVKNAASYWSGQLGVAIDPALVHGVLERESWHGTHPNYVRNAGVVPEPGGHLSYGPMQVYDDTLRTLAPGVPPADLARNPSLGIWYGVKYLAGLLKRFPGDTPRAVAAYNAGPNNAVRNRAGKFPNQSYVDAVLGFMTRYAATAAAMPTMVAAGLLWWWFARHQHAGGE